MRAGGWQTTSGPSWTAATLGLRRPRQARQQVARVGEGLRHGRVAWSQNLTDERAAEAASSASSSDELFARADVVSDPLRAERAHAGAVGADELGLMKPTAFLINTSRGPIVDEAALLEALQRGAIAGAGLDVFDTEPLPGGPPAALAAPTVLTPHIGYVSTAHYGSCIATSSRTSKAGCRARPCVC